MTTEDHRWGALEAKVAAMDHEIHALREFKHDMPNKLQSAIGSLELKLMQMIALSEELKGDIGSLAKQGEQYLTKRDLRAVAATLGAVITLAGLAVAWIHAH